MIATTTLEKILSHGPRGSDWNALIKYLNKTEADDAEIKVSTILEAVNLDFALWCLRASNASQRDMRMFAVWCARQAEIRLCECKLTFPLEVAEKHANEEATDLELISAWADANIAAKKSDLMWSISKAVVVENAAKAALNAAQYSRMAADIYADGAFNGYLSFNSLRDAQAEKFKEMFCHANTQAA